MNSCQRRSTTPSSSATVSGGHRRTLCPYVLATLYKLSPYVLGVYVSTIFAGAFAFGVGFDIGITAFWDRWNQGVRPPVLDPWLTALTCIFDRPRNNGRTSVINTLKQNRLAAS